ncbi:putative manganese efflux pump MntP [Gammaproteobacteria bacterium]
MSSKLNMSLFGFFQALMPVIGWLAGLTLRDIIETVDHWVAFGLLLFVGGKMIYEALWLKQEEQESDDGAHDLATLLILSIATSLDALAVGLSLSLVGVNIVIPSAIIGVVCFGFTLAGVWIGSRIGHLFEEKIEIVGGMILIGIGTKILYDHLT